MILKSKDFFAYIEKKSFFLFIFVISLNSDTEKCEMAFKRYSFVQPN
jgi:hypothetical protein